MVSKLGINKLKELLTDSADLSLSWVDNATCEVVDEVRFVIFKNIAAEKLLGVTA